MELIEKKFLIKEKWNNEKQNEKMERMALWNRCGDLLWRCRCGFAGRNLQFDITYYFLCQLEHLPLRLNVVIWRKETFLPL